MSTDFSSLAVSLYLKRYKGIALTFDNKNSIMPYLTPPLFLLFCV